MLRGLVICPDAELARRLDEALAATGRVTIVRDLDQYPSEVDLMRSVRAHAPHVIFLSTESLSKAVDVIGVLDQQVAGVQLVAVGRSADPQLLIDVMRAGIREFLSMPFDPAAVYESLSRIDEQAQKRPLAIETTDHLYAFLPAKAGVGASTIALNTAVALARDKSTNVLLMDLDLSSGIISFMLKQNSQHSVVEASENAQSLDESLWPQLVSRAGNLEVLGAGRLNPDARLDSAQLRMLLEFARRHYKAICVDLSGHMERFALDLMQESRKIFLVCTPEIPALHLAREKLSLLSRLDLADRVHVLLNRSHKRSLITPSQVQDLLRVPVSVSFPNDYQGVHRALQAGRAVEPTCELGQQFTKMANMLLERKPVKQEQTKKSFAEYFSILPGRLSTAETKKTAS